MLTEKQVEEIKGHLDRAQNPIFFFDNDQDGLCSFLILQRYIGRGKGIPIKSFPELIPGYFRKINELRGDYIFILDKPLVSKGFFEKAMRLNIPIIWIDHHEIDESPSFPNVYYYNPLSNKNKTEEPVTALCFQISEKKEDNWLAVTGCIPDNYVPDAYENFRRNYPELASREKDVNAFDIFYKSRIGEISRMMGFALKDRTTNVVRMMKFLMKARGPHDVLEETGKNYTIHKRYVQINSKYQRLLQKAVSLGKASGSKKFLFFQYSGDLSISGDLASELHYLFPGKIIVVMYIKGMKANISMRGKNVKDLILKSIEGLENARGGGHDEAVGGQIQSSDVEKFRENLEKEFDAG